MADRCRSGDLDPCCPAAGQTARYAHLYSPKAEGEELQSTQRKFLPAVTGYVIAILIGLALTAAAVALYFGLAVYLVVPSREAARVLRRRHSSRQ